MPDRIIPRPFIWVVVISMLSPTALPGQNPVDVGLGIHSEGGGVRPGVHGRVAQTLVQPLGFLSIRGELWGAISRYELHDLNIDRVFREQQRSVGAGIGAHLEPDRRGVRPFAYVAPTYTRFSYSFARPASWLGGFAAGVGVRFPAGDRVWFTDLSWRSYGPRTWLGALTLGLEF